MSSDDHWVDDSYKKNNAFGQKREDVRSRGAAGSNGAPVPPPAVTEKRQKQTMTNTQLRLAALPQEYLQQQKSPEEVGKYSPGYFAQPGASPQTTSNINYQAVPSQTNIQPNYSQQNTQPNYSQQNYSQQNTQPNYSQQTTQPIYQQQVQPQMQQPVPQNYPPPNYPPQPGPEYSAPQQHFVSQSQRFSQQFGQPDYSQATNAAEFQQQQQQFAQQQFAQQQYAQQQYAQQQQLNQQQQQLAHQQQQFAQQQQLQQQQTADIPPRANGRELTIEEIDDRALYDSHTRAYNLRHTLRLVRTELLRASHFNRSMSLLIVSIDKYDEVLRDHTAVAIEKAVDAVSRTLIQCARPVDVVGRYMDRRFMIVCPEMDSQQATELAEKIRTDCESIVISHNWKNISLSASVGIASLSPDCSDVESFIALADLGADMVAENGGNGVFFAAGAE